MADEVRSEHEQTIVMEDILVTCIHTDMVELVWSQLCQLLLVCINSCNATLTSYCILV